MAERRVDIRIDVDDTDAGKRLDDIAAKIKKIAGTFTVKLNFDDGGAKVRLDEISERLDRIGSKTYTPKIGMSGITKADAELDKLDTRLDKIGHKRVTATVHVRTSGTAKDDIERLLGSAGSGAGGGSLSRDAERAAGGGGGVGAGGLLSALGGANNSIFGGLIAALIAYAMAVGPGIIPLGIGGLVGGGGALAAGKLGTTGITTLKADRQALAQAQAALAGKRGNTPSNRLSLREAEAALQKAQTKYGGVAGFGRQVNALGSGAENALIAALTGNAPGEMTGGNRGGLVPGSSFLAGITPILAQIAVFIKQIGPGLGNLFRASLPSLEAFVKIGEQFAMAMLPAMTQSLKAIQPDIPILVQGFKFLSEGIAGFITDLGPGMRDASVVFKESMLVVKGFLQLIGISASAIAISIVKTGDVIRDVAKHIPIYFDEMRHGIANYLDDARHRIAYDWDGIWQDTIGKIIRGVGDVNTWFANMRHGILSQEDTIRSDIAGAWNTIWTNTVNAVSRGVHDVEGWFERLPGNILNALKNLGRGLENLGRVALDDLLAGLKSGGGAVLSWAKNFIGGLPGDLMKFLHMSPPHPGSAFYDLGANIMHHFSAGIKSATGKVASIIHGAVGGSAGSAQHYAQSLLGRFGWSGQWGALNSVAERESGWSTTARNPSSGAYGIAQFINGPSEYYQYGGNPSTVSGQVIAFMNYIRQRYGDPNAAWAHELNFGWYDQGGKLPPGLTLALNATGHDEHIINPSVTPMGGGGGGSVYITVQGDTDPDGAALRIVQKLRKYKTRHGGAALGIG